MVSRVERMPIGEGVEQTKGESFFAFLILFFPRTIVKFANAVLQEIGKFAGTVKRSKQ